MINRNIVDFIAGNMKRGIPYDEIHQQLLMRGYADFDIQEAKNFLMQGQTIQSNQEYPNENKIGVKWVIITLIVVVFVIILFVLFAALFSGSSEKRFDVSSDSLVSGVNLELSKNNMIVLDGDENNYLTIKVSDAKVNVEYKEAKFSMFVGQNYELDLDLDSKNDLILSFWGGEENVFSLKTICIESWSCSDWGACVMGVQKRVCADENSCGTNENLPIIEQECEMVEVVSNVTVENVTEEFKNETIVEIEENQTSLDPVFINSSIELDFPEIFYNTGEELNASYLIDVEYNRININILSCFLREGYPWFCGEYIPEEDSGRIVLNNQVKAFYADNDTHFTHFGGIHYPGAYRYEYRIYTCEAINKKLGVENCSVSDDRILEMFEANAYDLNYKIINVMGDEIPFECLNDEDCESLDCRAGSCFVE